MKKTTLKHSNNLSKRLARYGALSLAIAGVSESNGQIQYTDVEPDFVGTLQSSFAVDFNEDATVDGVIEQTSFVAGSQTIQLLRALAPAGNGIAANMVGAYTYGINVPYGSAIGPGTGFFSFGDMCQAGGYTNSGFCSTTEDSYVGMLFDISGSLHYGWVRLAAGSTSSNFTVLDYAYETTPNTAINAGQSLSVEDFAQAHNYVISFTDNQVTIGSIVDQVNYRIISLSGQIVMNGSSQSESEVISLSSLSAGVYIIEVTDGNEQRIQRKKIVVN